MKAYLKDVINQLSVWSENPKRPYEREDYKTGDYAVVGVGALSPQGIDADSNDIHVSGFHELIGFILNDGENDFGLEGPHGVALILMVNKITEDRSVKGEVHAQGVMYHKGKLGRENGPAFQLAIYPPLDCYHWKAKGSNIPSSNLEHILSVILYSPTFMQTFRIILESFFTNMIDDEKEVSALMDELDIIHHRINSYSGKTLH